MKTTNYVTDDAKAASTKAAAIEIARAIVALERVASGPLCDAAYKPLAEANKAMDTVLFSYWGAHAASILRAEAIAFARKQACPVPSCLMP